MTNLIVTFRNFAKAPENDRISFAVAFRTVKKKQHFCIFCPDIYTNVSYKAKFFSSGLFKVGFSNLRHYLFTVGTYVPDYIASRFGNS